MENNDNIEILIDKENWQKTTQNESETYSDQSQNEYIKKMKGIEIEKDKYKSEKKGLSIEIKIESKSNESMYVETIMHNIEVLLTQWTKTKVIDRVYDLRGEIINDEYKKLDN